MGNTLFCSGRDGKTKRDAIHLYASPVIIARTPRCTIFELFPERFKKDLGIEGDYNPTKSNGGRSREETEEGRGGGRQRSCKGWADRLKENTFIF